MARLGRGTTLVHFRETRLGTRVWPTLLQTTRIPWNARGVVSRTPPLSNAARYCAAIAPPVRSPLRHPLHR